MNKKGLSAILLFLAFLISVPSTVFATTLQSDPQPKAPQHQRDKYNTDIFTGSANYSYPFKVPKGTNDLTPDVSFNYSSAGVRDPKTSFGIGWQLQRSYVERDINNTPASASDDKFKLHFKGQTHDLVFVSSEGRYHTAVESYLNIKKLSGANNFMGDYWLVITPDGTKYRFGYDGQSENHCSTYNNTAQWNLDLVTDANGNNIYYTYTEANNLSYLDKIEYNNEKSRAIHFNYITNPYVHEVYLQGCLVDDRERLQNVMIEVNYNLVHQYDFVYHDGADNKQPLLKEIVEKGSSGSALPKTIFEYHEEVQDWETTPDPWINNADIDTRLDKDEVEMADVNGDGLQDIIKTEVQDHKTDWKVFKNTGSDWETNPETWVNDSHHGARLNDDATRLIDVTGDNLPDIVRAENAAEWRVWRNLGNSWDTNYEQWANLSGRSGDIHLKDNRVALSDVTGDGLPDIVRTWWNGNMQWEIFRNTGSSWSTSHEVFMYNVVQQGLDSPRIRLMDINADGVSDIVRTDWDDPTNQSTWFVWRGTGNGWGSQGTWLDDDVDAYFESSEIAVSDVNGDNLPDIIRSEDIGSTDEWKAIYNLGGWYQNYWDNWINTSDNVDLDVHNANTKLIDVTGDGLPDIVKGYQIGGGYVTWNVYKNKGKSPHLLKSVHTPQGGLIDFEYQKSTAYDNTGADSQSDLPFPLWVVSKMTVNNGLDNDQETEDVTTYAYKDGYYYWQGKDFRGFKEVNTVEPNGSKKKYVFHQDDALKGKIQELQHRDSSDNPYFEVENAYDNSSSNGVYKADLIEEKFYTYDGNASNPKIKEVEYTRDSYGNVTKKSELGDTSVSGDERFTYTEYVASTSGWIVNTPKRTYLNAANDSTKVSESWFYYDGNSGFNDTPIRGDVTKEVKWLSGGTNPETEYAYDSFGNQIEMTDARGHTTYTDYDSTGTYPTYTANAKGHEEYMGYDLGTGNLLWKTDANGFTTNYEYDQWGRLLKEIKPGDSSSYPTVSYQYYVDGIDGVKVSKREASASAGTIDTYTWVDGIGRTIQSRTEAENTSNQIVVNTYYDETNQVGKVTVPHLTSNIDYYASPVASISATETTYDVLGRVSIVENPKGDTKTTAYDHWKVTDIDENGHIKRKYLNAYDKIVKVEEVLNGADIDTEYTYDSRDLLTNIEDAPGNDITFTYDSLGRKTQQTDPDMGTWTYAYDAVGNLTSQTDNRSVTVTKTYDELNRLTKTNYPSDTDTSFIYDGNGRKGTVTIATDSAGTVNFFYDNRLRKTKESRIVNGTTKATEFTYDSSDRQVTQKNPDNEVITNTFNAQGEIESVSNLLSNINYNAFGKITKKQFANGVSTDYTYNTTDFRLNRIQTGSVQDLNYTYDNVGNVATITDSIASKTQTFGYDDLDRLKIASESGGYNHSYTYNSIGNLTAFNDGAATINYLYGGNGKPHAMTSSSETVTAPLPAPAGTPLTATLKDTWNSGVIAATKWLNWGGSQVSLVSNQLRMTSTLSGGYYGIDSAVNNKVYNLTSSSVVNEVVSAGNQSLSSWEVYPIYMYADGNTSNQYFFYISGNTLKAYKKVNGTNTQLYTTTYNSTNHRWFRITEWDGTTYFDVSADGKNWNEVATTANAFDVTEMTIGAEVGTWQTHVSTTYATFDNFNYGTAPANTLQDDWATGSINSAKWLNWGGNKVSVASQELRINSNAAGGYYGIDSDVSGVMYDLTGSAVVNKVVNAGNQSLGSWEVYPLYVYPDGDNTYQYYFYIGENDVYAYKKVDDVDTQLASVAYNSTNHAWFRIREENGTVYFDTSADGGTWNNLTSTESEFSMSAVGVGVMAGTWSSEGSTTNAKFDNFNVWNPVYTYDANGNMTSDGHKCYEFNEANQLKKAKACDGSQTIAEYVYDYNGNRMVKKVYEGGTLKETITSWSDSYETKVSGATTENTTYYFVNNELIGKKDNAGNRTYIHNDHLGSASVITNSSGVVVESTKYDPWGEVKSGGTKSKFLYTGQEKDLETDLNYYNARYYDSHIRRFTQPDDIITDVYNPQSLNRYSYVHNNPLKYTDPTGHWIVSAFQAVSSYINSAISFISNLVPKAQSVASSPRTQTVSQNVTKTQSNPVVQKTRSVISNTSVQASETLNNAGTTMNNTVNKVQDKVQVHGNDLRNTATTWGYTLRDRTTGVIQKFGESINPGTRYTKKWLEEHNVALFPETSGNKAEMRIWEHEQIGNYIFQNGAAPALNNIERSVNVFR